MISSQTELYSSINYILGIYLISPLLKSFHLLERKSFSFKLANILTSWFLDFANVIYAFLVLFLPLPINLHIRWNYLHKYQEEKELIKIIYTFSYARFLVNYLKLVNEQLQEKNEIAWYLFVFPFYYIC